MIQKETYSLKNIQTFNIAATAIDLMKQNTSFKNNENKRQLKLIITTDNYKDFDLKTCN